MLVAVCFVLFVFCVVFEQSFSYQRGRKLISAKCKIANFCAIITLKVPPNRPNVISCHLLKWEN
jgi:hypothetical protein